MLLSGDELRNPLLIAEHLAEGEGGRTVYRRDMLATVQRRGPLRVAG